MHQGVKINTNLYINNILVPAFEEIKKYFKYQPFTFQQDEAPSHTSIKTQDWCKRHFSRFWSKKMYPPASPDLNPMNCSMWSVLKAKVCSVANTIVDAMNTSVL